MPSTRTQASIANAALALIWAAVSCSEANSDPVEAGAPAPDYAAALISGEKVSLAALRGNVVLLNAWATWCKPCIVEIPQLIALHHKYGARGLKVVGVSLDEDTSTANVAGFVSQHGMVYQIWRDPAQRFSARFRFDGLPMTVLIDTAGVLRWVHRGKLPARDTTLDAAIRKALGG